MGQTLGFNQLKNEKSAYLIQHKDNPVHWYAWGPEAFLKAEQDNKPIFLSVGYSSCHWCHVMAHESFEDQDTADYLNENFVCIKVDKEEFPDVDNYYQQASQLFIKSGGWPLSAFLLPDKRPFFAGTYYPKKRVSPEGATFMELLSELIRAYKNDNEKVLENAKNVTEAIEKGLIPNDKIEFPDHFPQPAQIMDAIKEYEDKEHGGYGGAPKFPHFAFYEWAIEQILEGMIPKEQGQHIVDSLEKMMMGGLFDQARGGIHRYSVDEKWTVPHFEKMLYDQAGFLKMASKLSMLYPSPLVFDQIIKTLDYLEVEMLSEQKYFFSAQDADSEGVEGLYFTYTKEEFEDIVNNASEQDDLSDKMNSICEWFNITDEGNFEKKLNVISLNSKFKETLYTNENWEIVRRVLKSIIQDRKNRIPPATDNKGIASWHFMIVSALVDVMQYCPIDFIKQKASSLFNQSVEGIYSNFLVAKDDNAMKIRHTTTLADSLLYFEDYVMFTEAQLRIYEITGNPVFKENFSQTIEFILKEFLDNDHFKTRAISIQNEGQIPNQEYNFFDSSFKSASATMISILRRGSILLKEKDLVDRIELAHEKLKNISLKNPLSAGEGLRASTYPIQAYRTVQIPSKWLENNKFINFVSYFLPRFVLDYHQEENENWQICNFDQCELQGDGLDNFIQTLRPNQNENGTE